MQEKSARRSNAARSASTRGALIGAARALFAEKGYGETGTPEIVAKAQVTRGALYHHFADKADLLRAVVSQEAAAVARRIDADSAESLTPLEALMTGSDAYFAAMAEPGRARLLLLEGPAALGHAEMAEIDRATGGATLRQGLAALISEERATDALAEILSAAFDRAALAIAEGAPPEDYRAALRGLLEGLAREAG